jgi:hypothetical protein
MDIYPTLCELAGLPIPEQPLNAGQPTGRPLRGRSLVPVLADPDASVHAGAFTLYRLNGGHGYAYRTKRFRYIEWIDSSDTVTARELYDYQVDPLETTNLVNEPRYATVVYQLSRSMRVETTSRGAPRLQNSAPIPASGAGIELGDGLLPDLEIARLNASAVHLQWPWSNGVTYDVTQKTNLQQPAWSTAVSSVVGERAEFPVEGAERYYRVQLGGNLPPVFHADPIVMPNAITNAAYAESLVAQASDEDIGDTLEFAKLDGPPWLAVDPNGDLSGTPSASDLGAGYFTVQVTDTHGATAQAKLQITVTAPPPPPPASVTNIFNATDDTFAKQANPTLDAGGRTILELRQDGGSNFARVGYLKFTVTGVSNVIGAKLFLHSNNESDLVNALAVADVSWTEHSLNWSNRPPTGALLGSSVATPGAWFAVDVSSHVTTNGTYAIALDEQGNSYQDLDSKEGGYPPRLEVESAFE